MPGVSFTFSDLQNVVPEVEAGTGFPLRGVLEELVEVVPVALGVEVVGVQGVPASEGLHLLVSLQLPEWSPVYEERRLPGKENDDVEQVYPVLAQGVGRHVAGKVHVAASDDVEKLSICSQHL